METLAVAAIHDGERALAKQPSAVDTFVFDVIETAGDDIETTFAQKHSSGSDPRRVEAVKAALAEAQRTLGAARAAHGVRHGELEPLLSRALLGIFAVDGESNVLRNVPFGISDKAAYARTRKHMWPELKKAESVYDALKAALIHTVRPSSSDAFYRQLSQSAAKERWISSIDLKSLAALSNKDLQGWASSREKGVPDIKMLLPEQKIAPARFDVVGDRIVLAREECSAEAEDEAVAAAVRTELIRSGDKLLALLRDSNCDRRAAHVVEYLQDQLVSDENIVRIALANVACDLLVGTYGDEFPAPVALAIRAHSRGVEMYAAQFPDWQRFVENAALVQLDQDDVAEVGEAASKLIREIESKPEAVDPTVPQTLRFLNELVRDPKKASKRTAFAVLRSIENFVSKAWTYCCDVLGQTFDKTKSRVADHGSKVLAGTILGLALYGANGISPVASKVQEMQWLQTVRDLVEGQLARLGKAD